MNFRRNIPAIYRNGTESAEEAAALEELATLSSGKKS